MADFIGSGDFSEHVTNMLEAVLYMLKVDYEDTQEEKKSFLRERLDEVFGRELEWVR